MVAKDMFALETAV